LRRADGAKAWRLCWQDGLTREALMGRAAALGRGRDTGGPGRRPGTPI